MSADCDGGTPPADGSFSLRQGNVAYQMQFAGFTATDTLAFVPIGNIVQVGPDGVTYTGSGGWTDDDSNPVAAFTDFPLTYI